MLAASAAVVDRIELDGDDADGERCPAGSKHQLHAIADTEQPGLAAGGLSAPWPLVERTLVGSVTVPVCVALAAPGGCRLGTGRDRRNPAAARSRDRLRTRSPAMRSATPHCARRHRDLPERGMVDPTVPKTAAAPRPFGGVDRSVRLVELPVRYVPRRMAGWASVIGSRKSCGDRRSDPSAAAH
jgi:hypothetical protein